MQQKCCVASCKKSRNDLYFSQRCEASCCVWHVKRNLQRNFVKMSQSERVLASFADIYNFQRARCKLRRKLRTCDTPSATCNVFQSSSLRCKLRGKLLYIAYDKKFTEASIWLEWLKISALSSTSLLTNRERGPVHATALLDMPPQVDFFERRFPPDSQNTKRTVELRKSTALSNVWLPVSSIKNLISRLNWTEHIYIF